MSNEDIFREVDEDLRREEIAKLWDKYGVYALVAAACIIFAVGGYKAYAWWHAKQMAENGTAFHQAVTLAAAAKDKEAFAAFDRLAREAPGGYRTLATLRAASLMVKEGRKAEALALYDGIARGAGDAALKDYARIEGAALRVDEADPEEIVRRLEGLNTDTNPWRYSARELLGLAFFRSGNMLESEKLFGQILGDRHSPTDIRDRAEMMLALLVKKPEPGAAGPKDAAPK